MAVSKIPKGMVLKEIEVSSASASAWNDHFYQNVSIRDHVPNGKTVYAVTLGAAESGGVLGVTLQDQNTVRLLNDTNFTGRLVRFWLLIG